MSARQQMLTSVWAGASVRDATTVAAFPTLIKPADRPRNVCCAILAMMNCFLLQQAWMVASTLPVSTVTGRCPAARVHGVLVGKVQPRILNLNACLACMDEHQLKVSLHPRAEHATGWVLDGAKVTLRRCAVLVHLDDR